MHSLEGKKAIEEIANLWALNDGEIRSIALRAEETGVVLEVSCLPRSDSPVKELRLRFSGVTRFELLWSQDHVFFLVPGYKALVKDSGQIYFSLDPYDDRDTAPDPRDGGVIEAHSLCADFIMKS